MDSKRIALVTGANAGIGLQIAKDLVGHGLTVLVGARDPGKGAAAAESIGDGAHAIQLDVTDAGSIAAAAERIEREFGRLDVLVNNAGVSHASEPGTPFAEIMKGNPLTVAPMADVRAVWDVNVFGIIAVTQAMLPLLRQSPAARIVTVGSSAGSLTLSAAPENPNPGMFGNYTASKTAAHAVTLAFALTLKPEGIKVNMACPGYTSTALNDFNGYRTAEQGAKRAVELALLGEDGPTGTFSDENGTVPW